MCAFSGISIDTNMTTLLKYLGHAGVLLLFWSTFSHSAYASQIYKYVDENGVVTYTNIKPSRDRYRVVDLGCYGICGRKVDWHQVRLRNQDFANEIRQLAGQFAVDPALVQAIVHVESHFNPQAVSRKGAQGLMQLMPATQAQYGVSNPFEPLENLSAGIEHLSGLLDTFEGSVNLAAAAYNAGAGAVRQYNGIPPYQETREYVRRVNILYDRYKKLSS
ncbi:MAG: lytic transglycosylase domain-containing protein [Xanthomonadales bacterium]|jgi:soluble lytic murein transglycosylase-like protein|nr:lytic transglycosylase domain-containing protein [Xanthomonadales bacterium]